MLLSFVLAALALLLSFLKDSPVTPWAFAALVVIGWDLVRRWRFNKKIWGILADATNDTSIEPSETELYAEKELFASRMRVFVTPFYVIVSVVLVIFSVAC